MSKRLILIGGGNFSGEIAEVALMLGYEIVGYLDVLKTNSSLDYLGTVEEHIATRDVENSLYFPAFGAVDRNSLMRRAASLSVLSGLTVPSLISPNAVVSDDVSVGAGAYIAHGAIVNRSTQISPYVIVNSNTTIGHNVIISNNTIISGNVFVGGGCRIGANSLVGPGSTLLHGIALGECVVVSFGSVVGRNIGDFKTTIPILSKVI